MRGRWHLSLEPAPVSTKVDLACPGPKTGVRRPLVWGPCCVYPDTWFTLCHEGVHGQEYYFNGLGTLGGDRIALGHPNVTFIQGRREGREH